MKTLYVRRWIFLDRFSRAQRENIIQWHPSLSVFLPKSGSGKVMWRSLQEAEATRVD